MIEILLVSVVALGASLLTFFSGFGLGTILMPFVAIFLPLELAIAITAIVHFANNIFKFGLVYKNIDYKIFLSFGIPAMIFSFFGAMLLLEFNTFYPLMSYTIFGISAKITIMKLLIGVIILSFVAIESYPKFANATFDKKYISFGGALSGFFGGLSGHQGAFRSMFLLKSGLSKEAFIATGIAIAVIVDISRLGVYGFSFEANNLLPHLEMVVFATLFAFVGSYFGAKLLKKVTIDGIKKIVSLVLSLLAILFILGVL